MRGLGTIVNGAAIIIGGLLGLVAGGGLKERFQQIINTALALAIIAMSLSGIVSRMLVVSGESVSTRGTYMLIFSLVLGAVIGEALDIDGKMERFGEWLKKKTGNSGDHSFVDAFVTSSLTVCIGAMAVVGSVMDGISGDHSILFTKAILDMIIIMVFAASKGKGAVFSAIPVVIFQGAVTILATLISPLFTDLAVAFLSLTGSVLILCVGVNMLTGAHYRIKVANLLPAIVFAVAAAFIPFLQG